jgi:hypothetical protein
LQSLKEPEVAVEIHGAAIADTCVLIVECKATLDLDAALLLDYQLGVIL